MPRSLLDPLLPLAVNINALVQCPTRMSSIDRDKYLICIRFRGYECLVGLRCEECEIGLRRRC